MLELTVTPLVEKPFKYEELFRVTALTLNVLVKARILITGFGRKETKKGNNIIFVAAILDNTDFQLLSEVVPKHNIHAVIFVALNLSDHIKTLPHQTFINNT